MNIFEKVIQWVMYLLVFLVPLFFLPFSFEAFEFNKLYLIFFLVLAGVFAWLAKMVFIDKEIRFKRTVLDIPILAVVFLAILSTIFSTDRLSSLFGSYGRFSDGLIPLLTLALFYFFLTNNSVKIAKLVKLFIYSGSIVILTSYLSIFGIWTLKWPLFSMEELASRKLLFGFLPQVMLQKNFNPVSGSVEGLAIFLSVFLSLLVGILLTQKFSSAKKASFYWLILLAGSGLLVIIDFSPAWIVLLLTQLVLLVFSLTKRIFKEDVNKLLLPIFLVIISAVFLFANLPSNSLSLALPREAVLNQQESWSVSTKALTSSPKNIFLGSGPGTFLLDFSKFKSVEFNKTSFWQYRFDRAGDSFAETLATNGILGILAHLALIFLIFWFVLKSMASFLNTRLVKVQGAEENQFSSVFNPQLPLFLVLVALVVAQFAFYQNTILLFTFWFFLALNAVKLQKESAQLKYSFKEFPEIGLLFGIAMIVIAVVFLGLYFFAGRFYLADTSYLRAIIAADASTQTKNFESAERRNPYQTQYKIVLSRLYLSQVLSEISKPSGERDQNMIQDKIVKAVDLARVATEISPKNVATWENRGLFYREVNNNNLVYGASDWAVKSFETASSLEPTNPVFPTEIGKLLLATKPEDAKADFIKALELKPDYSDAIVQLASVLEGEGKKDQAIKNLEAAATANPYDTDVLFQLGRLYYNDKRADEAILVFKQIIYLAPGHSNAHYVLGVIYVEKGEKGLALSEFKKVLELNPGDQDVLEKIKSLEK